MNGPHDLGGAHGFGAIPREDDEPVFHHRWEGRVFGMQNAASRIGFWHIDRSRHARERIPPAKYLASSYYENWFAGLKRLLVENRLATRDEIDDGKLREPGRKPKRVLRAADVETILRSPYSYERASAAPAKFKIGDRVRGKIMHPAGHTRLPRYARGRAGEVVAIRGCHVFPDSHAATDEEDPQWLYGVAFSAPELWGSQGRAGDEIILDLFEPYLDRA